MTGKPMAHAFCAALAVFLFGLCGGHVFLKHVDKVYSPGMVIAGSALAFVLFWTHLRPKRLAMSAASLQSSRQFLWPCVFFAMTSMIFGLQVAIAGSALNSCEGSICFFGVS